MSVVGGETSGEEADSRRKRSTDAPFLHWQKEGRHWTDEFSVEI